MNHLYYVRFVRTRKKKKHFAIKHISLYCVYTCISVHKCGGTNNVVRYSNELLYYNAQSYLRKVTMSMSNLNKEIILRLTAWRIHTIRFMFLINS